MHRCLRSTILLVPILLSAPALAQKADSPATPAAAPAAAAATPTGPKYAEFAKLFDQWKGLLQQLRDLREEYRQAKSGKRPEIQKQYDALVRQGEAMQSQVLDAAVAAFEETPTDKQLIDFMYGVIYSQVTSDQYEDVFRLAKPMIDQGVPERIPAMANLYSWAGNAAFAIGEFDLAEQYLTKAVKLEKTGENDKKYLSTIPYYREIWPKEQAIRQTEAKVDDLPRVLLRTNRGDIVIELFENEAPNTVANFISLVEKGFYNGLSFHRVLPAFMAQGGCPEGTGAGGPGYTIRCECYEPNHRLHFRGTLSMANTGQRDTGGSQFFLTFVPTPHLDGKHTVFGRVIEGMDVLGKLRRRDPEDPDSAAMDPDKILEAKVIRKLDHPYEPKTLPAR
jgi:cyclophilin family peptidyl-prolyl cis-trans isomerase